METSVIMRQANAHFSASMILSSSAASSSFMPRIGANPTVSNWLRLNRRSPSV